MDGASVSSNLEWPSAAVRSLPSSVNRGIPIAYRGPVDSLPASMAVCLVPAGDTRAYDLSCGPVDSEYYS